MATIWKVGSRWGNNPGASLLRIFRRNGVVFIGHEKRLRAFEEGVRKDNYIAISDGKTIVAVAKVLDEKPCLLQKLIEEKVVRFKKSDILRFKSGKSISAEEIFANDRTSLAVRVKIVDLEKYEQVKYDIGTFERVKKSEIRQLVINAYENRESAQFDIESYTCTLLKGSNGKKSILDSQTFYNIPIYQREYSWQEEQVCRFIRDIYDGYIKNEPMFIGTMQLSAPKFVAFNESEQDVIDGQQRFSTFLCLLKYINLAYSIDLSQYNITEDWLETRVNNGKENELLQKFLSISSLPELFQSDENKINRYVQNTITIANVFDELLSDEKGNIQIIDIAKYLDFLFKSVYFVVIETHSGLSKTIKIFNTINTTGLDLNGDDLFKVRFFEYLKDKQNAHDNVFEEISQFYGKVKGINSQWQNENHDGSNLVSINEIRTIFKEYIISKFGLANQLFSMSTDTFFDRLFDQILGVQNWKDFNSSIIKEHEKELNLNDLYKILRVEEVWNRHVKKILDYEQFISWKLFGYTRYSRFKRIAYQVLLKEPNEEIAIQQAHILISLLFRIAYCESIRWAKVTQDTITKVYDLYKSLHFDGIESAISDASAILKNKSSDIESSIGREIFEKGKCHRTWGNLICMLSSYLDEKRASVAISDIDTKLFGTSFDLEHIHATANDQECENISPKLQNSIGNLMMLEYDINRSIGKIPFSEKKERGKDRKCYQDSIYTTVKEIRENYQEWGIVQIEDRKKKEIEKIASFLRQPIETLIL